MVIGFLISLPTSDQVPELMISAFLGFLTGAAANALAVGFGDFATGYLIVDRMGVRVLRDPFTNKPYVNFYTTKRVGGGVVNPETLRVMKVSA